jgi:tubulin alpha
MFVPEGDIPTKVDKSATLLGLNSNMRKTLYAISHKFDLMYANRASVPRYVGEGVENGEFDESREDIAAL